MTGPEYPNRRLQIPPGLTPGQAIDWLNQHAPVGGHTGVSELGVPLLGSRPRTELATPNPNWYEELSPVPRAQLLLLQCLGLSIRKKSIMDGPAVEEFLHMTTAEYNSEQQ